MTRKSLPVMLIYSLSRTGAAAARVGLALLHATSSAEGRMSADSCACGRSLLCSFRVSFAYLRKGAIDGLAVMVAAVRITWLLHLRLTQGILLSVP